MGKKFYAIKEGFDHDENVRVQNKVVTTWNECLKYVSGVKGAKYKSFENIEEANGYIYDTRKFLKKGNDEYPEDCIHLYVDGSYNVATEKYSYAFVVVENNVIIYMEHGASEDAAQKQIRQIAGELKAAIRAVEYSIKNNQKKVVILYDYEGIFHHAVGTWERKDASSKDYFDKMKRFVDEQGVEIIFVKIDSHTGDIYNEITDNYAKVAAGLTVTSAVDKWLMDNDLKVKDDHVKDQVFQVLHEKKLISLVNSIIEEDSRKCGKIFNEDNILEVISRLKDLIINDPKEAKDFLTNLSVDTKEKIILKLV